MNQACKALQEPLWTEEQRLKALKSYDILDTPVEACFDDIAKVAQHICDVPVVVINLIDENRQWFKSEIGLGVRETPLDVSICAHAIMQPGFFSVPDTTMDPRFQNNPLVVGEPYLRFYAGALLETDDGLPLGTLCVLDYRPRELTAHQKFALMTLARQVMSELDLRRTLRGQQEIVKTLQIVQNELKEAKEAAELANDRKSRVLAFVCHEFKNPLNAAIMFGELLQKGRVGDLTAAQGEYVQHMLTANQHVKDLMDDILDIAPVEVGLFKLSIVNAPLKDILKEVETIVIESAIRKNITLNFEIKDNIETVCVDPKRLRQILINLLSNAIKYTNHSDTVYLKISKHEDWIEYRVIDHGPGIAEDEIKRLFADYYRVQNTFSSQKEGLGLGLALIKTLVELHQGTISVESAAGIGATFIMRLPIIIADRT